MGVWRAIDSVEALADSGLSAQSSHSLAKTDDRARPTTNHNRFDLDVYFILVRFLLDPEKVRLNQIHIHQLSAITEADYWV